MPNHERRLKRSNRYSYSLLLYSNLAVCFQKKKLESDINELEVALDHANRTNSDTQKALKRVQQTLAELQAQADLEQQQRDEAREAAAAAERRANQLGGEIEELHTSLEQAERARKAAEMEMNDIADRISELSTQNANLASHKRQLESAAAAMQADLDEALTELKNSEERAKKTSKMLFEDFRLF